MRKKIRRGIKKILRQFGFHLEPEREAVFDVVCSMELPAAEVRYTSAHNGETYYFCSPSCKKHFDGEPQRYVG